MPYFRIPQNTDATLVRSCEIEADGLGYLRLPLGDPPAIEPVIRQGFVASPQPKMPSHGRLRIRDRRAVGGQTPKSRR
ncbi:MAG: hypothetical protein ISN28_09105 [Ectothiorhodospiraceae bacterium AqS1]|nr:hypothetical protein [Ectothiorhodospiraceae bacterium AqS1]